MVIHSETHEAKVFRRMQEVRKQFPYPQWQVKEYFRPPETSTMGYLRLINTFNLSVIDVPDPSCLLKNVTPEWVQGRPTSMKSIVTNIYVGKYRVDPEALKIPKWKQDFNRDIINETYRFSGYGAGTPWECAKCGQEGGTRGPHNEMWYDTLEGNHVHDTCWNSMTRLERVLAGYEKDPYEAKELIQSKSGSKSISGVARWQEVEAPSRLTWATDLQKPEKEVGISCQWGEEFEV